jgi:hypothetical protein
MTLKSHQTSHIFVVMGPECFWSSINEWQEDLAASVASGSIGTDTDRTAHAGFQDAFSAVTQFVQYPRL